MSRKNPSLPSKWKLLMELRAVLQWGAHALMLPTLSLWPKVETGIPVLVLPGLATPDMVMLPMRRALGRLGYKTYKWELGFNTHPTAEQMENLAERVKLISLDHGQPVALVGWSLGGAVARALAGKYPQHVRCVVALGSPLGGQVSSHLSWVHALLSGLSAEDALNNQWFKRSLRGVPLTSIASRSDGLLAWESSVVEQKHKQENILLDTVAHLGLPAHPMVLWLVHDRLRQVKSNWQPYQPVSDLEKTWLAEAAA